MRNIVDLEIDELLGEKPSSALETLLLEREDPTDPFLALLGSIDNISVKPLSS
jgi:hypothetical protein